MKHLVCRAVFLAACIFSFPTHAETHSAAAAKSALVLDITDTDTGLAAVGERGHVLLFDNDQWSLEQSPVSATLTRVIQHDGQLWAVGHDGVIVRNSASGWQLLRQDIAGEQPLMDLLFVKQNEAIAVGAYGEFLRSVDGGKTWLEEMHEGLLYEEDREYLAELKLEASQEDYDYELSTMLPHLNRVLTLSGNKLLMVGELGLVALSDDNGNHWRRLDVGYEGSFFAATQITVDKVNRLIIGGLRGNVYYSDNAGLDWHRATTESTATVNGFVANDNNELIALASNGQALISNDGGVTFTSRPLHQGETAVAGANLNGIIYIAGDRGIRQLDW
ncbi:hypothetical protein GCM10011369_19460 [Neiella marina]|uniref:Photosynthesis system II assembly factor Ycf48/Hcf136-like domain-containing protein n=1 Tax=Neiella marina TaxID=508461 RepID=A0A8J2U578_9GAMM|nr:hypothetical protein [Neiella marina]GGA77654.1 hypothetical protein GCM10011369_19460 [Neiella marina]